MFNQAVLKSEKRFNQMGKKMKKFTYAMLGAVLLLAGCRYHEFYYDEEALNAENNAAAESSVLAVETTVTAIPVNDPAASAAEEKKAAERPAPAAEEKEKIEVMNPDQPVEKLVYDSAYDRFLDNVVIKARSENYVTYEYKDVRVDELAPIASRYCLEHGNRTAVLRSVILYKNYARRATFDCLRLQ